MNTPTADPTDAPDPAREALIASIARRLDDAEARLEAAVLMAAEVDAMLRSTIVLTAGELEELRRLHGAPMVWTGSPATGGAVQFVRNLAARLPGRS